MYKRILIATDGSELAGKAEQHGIALAKAVGAAVVGVTVTIPLDAYVSGEFDAAIDPAIFEERTARMAAERLQPIADAARAAGVACTTKRAHEYHVYQAIVDAADQEGCDLIVMASHGRRGISGFILGSETTKVLTHSKVPVLVCR